MPAASDLVYALATVRRGRLFIRNRREFDDQIKALPDDWDLEVTVKRLRATRSTVQNRYYWGVVVQMLSDDLGYTPDEMHALLKMKFLPKRLAICDGNGEILDEFVVGGSTRELTTADFGEYLDAIRQWAAERGLVIPDPYADAPAPAPMVVHQEVWYRAKRRHGVLA
jgi:hypothetical protein